MVIVLALAGAVWGACRWLEPPEKDDLITVSGTFSRLETTVTSVRYSSHIRYWIYLEEQAKAYCVDDSTGFSKERFTARPGDMIHLLCTAEEPPSEVYGVIVNGEELLSYEQAARGTYIRTWLTFGGCALMGLLCWLGWVVKNRYTTKKPSFYRGYRGRRARR